MTLIYDITSKLEKLGFNIRKNNVRYMISIVDTKQKGNVVNVHGRRNNFKAIRSTYKPEPLVHAGGN